MPDPTPVAPSPLLTPEQWDKLKRWGTGLATALILALNKKLGLGLSELEQGLIVSLVLGMIASSNMKAVAIAKANAAGAVAAAQVAAGTDVDAAASLNAPRPP